MRNCSQSRNLHHQQQQAPSAFVEPFNLQQQAPPLAPMDDTRTMAQLLQAPNEGTGYAIEIPEINKITSTDEIPRCPRARQIKLMLFQRQIIRNEITRFQQRFDESFYEAWDRFNDLLRACPHHGFSELHQLDTFYNALNANDQDSLNSAAGGNFLDKMPRECLRFQEVNQGQVYQLRDSQPPVYQASTLSSSCSASAKKNLSLSELTPTCMTLELADRSISEPIGIAEDVYVMVGKFQFPADFIVVDFEPDPRVPLILGRSFLKTSRALIDVYEVSSSLKKDAKPRRIVCAGVDPFAPGISMLSSENKKEQRIWTAPIIFLDLEKPSSRLKSRTRKSRKHFPLETLGPVALRVLIVPHG
ncbi:reverse transcriptase domain-containing protein [Tanacetum coccineum]